VGARISVIFPGITLLQRGTDGLRVAARLVERVSRQTQELTFRNRLRLSRVFGSEKGDAHEEPLRIAVWRGIGDTGAVGAANRESILGDFTFAFE